MTTTSFLRWCTQLYIDGTALSQPRLSLINDDRHGLPAVHLNVGTRTSAGRCVPAISGTGATVLLRSPGR